MAVQVDVLVLDDADRFAEAAGTFLLGERFTANVIATNLEATRRGMSLGTTGASWIVAVGEGGAVRGAAMHTPPFPLFLPRLDAPVVDAFANALANMAHPLEGVNGECESVRRFAATWFGRTGRPSELRRSSRMYVLGELRPPLDVPGDARLAGKPDAALVARWVSAFHEEAAPRAPRGDWSAWAARRIDGEEIWLWTDAGEPVSMAGRSRPAVGVARVGPVYTPPDRRRNGYGSAVTAAASRAALAAGAEHVVLYTDLANPVSNAIYQAIGFVREHDAEERTFTG